MISKFIRRVSLISGIRRSASRRPGDKNITVGLHPSKGYHFEQTWQVCWIECDLEAVALETWFITGAAGEGERLRDASFRASEKRKVGVEVPGLEGSTAIESLFKGHVIGGLHVDARSTA